MHIHEQKVTRACSKSNTLLKTATQLLLFYLCVKNDSSVVSGWLRKWDPFFQQPNLCCSISLEIHATELDAIHFVYKS